MLKKQTNFESEHFLVEVLAPGIFGAVHRDGGWAIANAGLVDLGESCLVFDTFLTPEAGADLRRAAETLIGKPIRYVVNSHYHNDHIWGNQAFDPGTTIISSAKTQRLIGTKGQEEFDWYSANSGKRLAELNNELSQAAEEDEQESIRFWLDYYQALAESMPGLEPRWPNLTFKSKLSLRGDERHVVLHAFEIGHTGGDTILHAPEEAVIFMGDLLFVGSHPYLPDGDPAALLKVLEVIKAMEPGILLPGHGPVGEPSDLEAMIEYIQACMQAAHELAGADPDLQDQDLAVPQAFAAWEYPNFFQANVAFLLRQLEND